MDSEEEELERLRQSSKYIKPSLKRSIDKSNEESINWNVQNDSDHEIEDREYGIIKSIPSTSTPINTTVSGLSAVSEVPQLTDFGRRKPLNSNHPLTQLSHDEFARPQSLEKELAGMKIEAPEVKPIELPEGAILINSSHTSQATPPRIKSQRSVVDDSKTMDDPNTDDVNLDNDEDDEEFIGPPKPPRPQSKNHDGKSGQAEVTQDSINDRLSAQGDGEDADQSEEEEEEEEEEYDPLPITHKVRLEGHFGPVTSVACNQSGSRFISGSTDSMIRVYDFGSMDKKFKVYRDLEVTEGQPIRCIDYSKSGKHFLVTTGGSSIVLFNERGDREQESIKGDQYLQDLTRTKGHTTTVVGAYWHPTSANLFMSGSMDGSIRFWDPERMHRTHKDIIKTKTRSGSRNQLSALRWSVDGSKLAAAGSTSGNIMVFPKSGPWTRPVVDLQSAHTPGSETTCLLFSNSGNTILSRGGDSTLKVWDIRMNRTSIRYGGSKSQCIKEFSDLQNHHFATGMSWSNGQEQFVTTIGVDPEIEPGQPDRLESYGWLVFFAADTLEERERVPVSASSATAVIWHPRLNQIFVGAGDKSVHAFYSPEHSQLGIAAAAVRLWKSKSDSYKTITVNDIIVPGDKSSKDRRNQPSKRKLYEKSRHDSTTKLPQLPERNSNRGEGGRLGQSLNAYLLENVVPVRETAPKDPHQELIDAAITVNRPPGWVPREYRETQPVPIFADPDEDDHTASAITSLSDTRRSKIVTTSATTTLASKPDIDEDHLPQPPTKKIKR